MRRIDWPAVTLLLLFAAALRIIGISYGGLNPDYFPSYAPYGMAHEQLPVHTDEYVTVATPVNMALRGWLDPNFFEYPSFLINSNLVMFTADRFSTGLFAGANATDAAYAIMPSIACMCSRASSHSLAACCR